MVLRKAPAVQGFEVSVEAFESIHGHNAWALQNEGMTDF
jgi:GTP cyclohydrolase FolE2